MKAILALLLALLLAMTSHAEECSTSRCPSGTHCVEQSLAGCTGPLCSPFSCLANSAAQDVCAGVSCGAGKFCLAQPKQCITTPCPQYACLTAEEYVCATANCAAGSNCVVSPKQCFTTPCPQFDCVAPEPESPCALVDCAPDKVCVPEPKQCVTTPCDQYRCVSLQEYSCLTASCPMNTVCVYEPKQCFRAPCPQYACLPQTQCPQACALNFAPVCGSDGFTYSNECALRKAMCDRRVSLYVSHSGECQAPATSCPSICPAIYKPVCGSDGKTYGNECNLRARACEAGLTTLTVASEGECQNCNVACTMEYAPVCGTDGKTYGNSCSLKATACQAKSGVTVAYQGECQIPEVCPEFCTMDYAPVCGSNGQTYDNKCKLDVDACKTKSTIVVSHDGACAASCDIVCTEIYDPVCGDNLVTYGNQCFLSRGNCNSKATIAALHKGECLGSNWKQISAYDTNGNNAISFAEFSAALPSLTYEQAQAAYAGYDLNSDGKITETDFLVSTTGSAHKKTGALVGAVFIGLLAVAAVIGAVVYLKSAAAKQEKKAVSARSNQEGLVSSGYERFHETL